MNRKRGGWRVLGGDPQCWKGFPLSKHVLRGGGFLRDIFDFYSDLNLNAQNTGCFLTICVRCQPFLTSKTWTEIVGKSNVFKKRDATIF